MRGRRRQRESASLDITSPQSLGFIPKERKIVVPAGGADLAGNNCWQAAGCARRGPRGWGHASASLRKLLPQATHSVLGLAVVRMPLDRPVPGEVGGVPRMWCWVLMGLESFPASLPADPTQTDPEVGDPSHPHAIVSEVTHPQRSPAQAMGHGNSVVTLAMIIMKHNDYTQGHTAACGLWRVNPNA